MEPDIPALNPEQIHIQKTPDERMLAILITGDMSRPDEAGKLPPEAINMRTRFEALAAETFGYEEGSRDRQRLEEFSRDAMIVNYTITLGADGYSQYLGAVLFWLYNKIDSRKIKSVYESVTDRAVSDMEITKKIEEISSDERMVNALTEAEELQREYPKHALLRKTTKRHLHDMCILKLCTQGAGSEILDVTRILTRTDIHAANSFLLWQISDLFHRDRQPDWAFTEDCADYMEGVHSTIYSLGASEQPPMAEEGVNVLERTAWSGSLIYLRDLASSITSPEAFELGNQVLGEITGFMNPADRMAVLPHTNLVAEMDAEISGRLVAGTNEPGMMLMEVTHKGVWKTVANALDAHPEINATVSKMLSHVQSGEMFEQDPEGADNDVARKMRMVKNLDWLLQIPGVLSRKDRETERGKKFLAQIEEVRNDVKEAIREVPDIVRMRLVLDSQRFDTVLSQMNEKGIETHLGLVHTSERGETNTHFDILNPEVNAQDTIVDWVRKEKGNFGAVFYKGKTRSGVPMEIQIIPEKAYPMGWHSHQFYKQT